MNKSCIEQWIAEWIRHPTSTSVSPRLNYCRVFVILGPLCYCSSVWHQPCLEHCIHFRTWSLSAEELYTTRVLLPNSAVVCTMWGNLLATCFIFSALVSSWHDQRHGRRQGGAKAALAPLIPHQYMPFLRRDATLVCTPQKEILPTTMITGKVCCYL